MLYITSVFILAFSSWAVFSRHFYDGIVAKNLLSLAAILSALVLVDPWNTRAAVVSGLCFVGAFVYLFLRHPERIPLFARFYQRPQPRR